jgi:hypothetical protein
MDVLTKFINDNMQPMFYCPNVGSKKGYDLIYFWDIGHLIENIEINVYQKNIEDDYDVIYINNTMNKNEQCTYKCKNIVEILDLIKEKDTWQKDEPHLLFKDLYHHPLLFKYDMQSYAEFINIYNNLDIETQKILNDDVFEKYYNNFTCRRTDIGNLYKHNFTHIYELLLDLNEFIQFTLYRENNVLQLDDLIQELDPDFNNIIIKIMHFEITVTEISSKLFSTLYDANTFVPPDFYYKYVSCEDQQTGLWSELIYAG